MVVMRGLGPCGPVRFPAPDNKYKSLRILRAFMLDTRMINYYFRTVKDAEIKEIDGIRNGVWVHAETLQTLNLQSLRLHQSSMRDYGRRHDFFEVPRLRGARRKHVFLYAVFI